MTQLLWNGGTTVQHKWCVRMGPNITAKQFKWFCSTIIGCCDFMVLSVRNLIIPIISQQIGKR